MGFARINCDGNTFVMGGSGVVGPTTFYSEDLEIVRDQRGLIGIAYINAIVNGLDCEVCIGVSAVDPDGSPIRFLDATCDYIALSCPPYAAIPGGKML